MTDMVAEVERVAAAIMDPPTEEGPRPELRQQIQDAHELVVKTRVEMGVQFRLHGDKAPETMEAWKQYGDALHLFSNLMAQV